MSYQIEEVAFYIGYCIKPKENENIIFKMKGGMTMALTNGIRMKKGVSGPSTQESLSKIDGPATTFCNT